MKLSIKPFSVSGIFFSLFLCASCVLAQTSATYDLSHNVIAGGGEKSTSALYQVEGTIGQPAAGTVSTGIHAATNTQYSIRGGFWAFDALAPTAAAVSIGGRVATRRGDAVGRVRLRLLDASNGIERTALTNPFGQYRFDDVEIGRIYILRAESKKFAFTPEMQVLQLMEAREDLDFSAIEPAGAGAPDVTNKNQ